MAQMTPNQLADYIETWYEGGRRGLTILENLESDNVEDYLASCQRWFHQGDQRIHKVVSQLRGVELECDSGDLPESTSDDVLGNLKKSP